MECKAPHIKITQDTFDQIARYNLKLNANYLVVTNGLEHFYCKMDFENETYVFLKDIPNYKITKLHILLKKSFHVSIKQSHLNKT